MGKALRKPASTEPAAPTFHVVGKEPPATAGQSPFSDDPFAALHTAPKSKSGKTYPVATLTEQQRAIVSEVLKQKADYKTLEGSIKQLEERVKPVIVEQYIAHCGGLGEVPSGMLANGHGSDLALLTICGDSGGRYTELEKEKAGDLIAVLGSLERFRECFTDGTSLKIEMDEVPQARRAELAVDLMEVFTRHGIASAVKRKSIIVPTPEFKVGRWTKLDTATNQALQKVIPIIPSLRRK